ncbi:MAG: tRNA lysidine(34) synthetase TilS [Clostridia bacterium]|nr:tRNA lysidine(34) synthetase TilS [Clostridia bacterium]
MFSILDKFRNNIIEYNMISAGDKVLVGLSGGADSVMLLVGLCNLRKSMGFELYAAHVYHGIRGQEADEDQKFCKKICAKYDVVFYTTSFDIPSIASELKTSEENAGRIKRYEYFNSLCHSNGFNKIAIAHNMNDSVETTIINMIRGCSLNGLCGIKPVNKNIIRPMYNIERKEIEEYLSANGIIYCTDKTNFSDEYTRNKVRNNLIKTMTEINPSVVRTIFSNTKTLRSDDEFMSLQAESLNCVYQDSGNVIIDKTIFDNQHISIKKRIIYLAFSLLLGSAQNIEGKHVDILLQHLSSGNRYNMPMGVTATIAFDKIILSNSTSVTQPFEYKINPGDSIKINEFDTCEITFAPKAEFKNDSALYIDYDKVENDLILRSRRDGDRIIPYGMNGTKKLKNLFCELKIAIDERDRVPILCDGDTLVAVVPYRISELYKVTHTTQKILKIQMIKEK